MYPDDLVTLPDPATRIDATDGPTLRDKLVAILAPYKQTIEALEAKVGAPGVGDPTTLEGRVAALEGGGSGATVPGAPTIGTATAGTNSVTLAWTTPSTTGGSAITGYRVTPYVGSTAQAAVTVGAVNATTIGGLTSGTAYTFKVAAINSVGTGADSAASAAATPTAPVGGGDVVVPSGSLDGWAAYRDTGAAGARREVVVFGDSTTFGAGGNYSWVQQLRNRMVGAGLLDGGKGIFGGSEEVISYDSPEVNGIVSDTFSGSYDTYDTLGGGFRYDDGAPANATMVVRFRTTCLRLWYIQRPSHGSFTYSIDGGTAVTVNANAPGNPEARYAFISGLTAGTTHTCTIVNSGGSGCAVAPAPVNATGVAAQKQAISGGTFNTMFFGALALSSPWTQSHNGFRFQAPMGLNQVDVVGPAYSGMTVDTTHPTAERVKPILAIAMLGFNDLSNLPANEPGPWIQYVKRFAAACTAAGCEGVIASGQLPYNANWASYGATAFNALKSQAATEGLAFIDMFVPVNGPSLSYTGPTSNPHLTAPEYVAQGNYIWDNLLAVV